MYALHASVFCFLQQLFFGKSHRLVERVAIQLHCLNPFIHSTVDGVVMGWSATNTLHFVYGLYPGVEFLDPEILQMLFTDKLV